MIEVDRRWLKILHDLWLYRSRTVTVIAAIALGVTGIGMANTGLIAVNENYVGQYWKSNPAHTRIDMTPFGESLLRRIRRLPTVQAADARYLIPAQVEIAPGQTLPILLQAVPDFGALSVDRLDFVLGAQVPPAPHTILVERSVLTRYDLRVGDELRVQMPDTKRHSLTISGFVTDVAQTPFTDSQQVNGYITFETSYWLEHNEKGVFASVLHQNYNHLLVVTDSPAYTQKEIEKYVTRLERDILRLGPEQTVLSISIPPVGKPVMQDMVNTFGIVLEVAGIASLLLSGFLVTNVMRALISEQIRQIGILKAIGASTRQIIQIYLLMSLILGGTALIMAIPLGYVAAYGTAMFAMSLLNTDLTTFYLPISVLVLQGATALFVPAIATLMPALGGTRMTVREALTSGTPSDHLTVRVLSRFRAVTTLMTLSIRNAFRQPLRLALTLIALSIAGTTFISVMGVRGAMIVLVDELIAENNYDLQVNYLLDPALLTRDVEKEVLALDGVVSVESWKVATMHRVLSDGTRSGALTVIAVPPTTEMLHLTPVHGRWLDTEGRNTLFINYPGFEQLGSDALTGSITMEMNNAKQQWQVVGVFGRYPETPLTYVRLKDYERIFKTVPAQRILVIQTAQHDKDFADQVEARVLSLFKDKKWTVNSSATLTRVTSSALVDIDQVIIILVGAALLVAAIGGLGLANMLELNVMSRTREIGILRSLGARSYLIRVMVITESLTIGLVSTAAGAVLSSPFGAAMSDEIGLSLLARRLTYAFPVSGLALWLGIMTTISLVASLAPAQKAITLTVRDALAYE